MTKRPYLISRWMTYVYLTQNLLVLLTRKIVSKLSGKGDKLSGFQSKQNNKDWYLSDQPQLATDMEIKITLSMFPANWLTSLSDLFKRTLQNYFYRNTTIGVKLRVLETRHYNVTVNITCNMAYLSIGVRLFWPFSYQWHSFLVFLARKAFFCADVPLSVICIWLTQSLLDGARSK